MLKSIEIPLGDEPLRIETGRVARQAGGAVWIRQGETVVLVTACMDHREKDLPFLPLTCEYRENMYAAGKIPGGFFKREGRPNEKETLACRLMDRPIRPLFPEGWRHESQVIALILSADKQHNPDVLAVTGASFALNLSPIPFRPFACVRVGTDEDGFLVNPTAEQMATSRIDLIVAGHDDGICMVECSALEIDEAGMLDALEFGHRQIRAICDLQKGFIAEAGVEKFEFTPPELPEDVVREVRDKVSGPLWDAIHTKGKLDGYAAKRKIKENLMESVPEEDDERRKLVAKAWDAVVAEMVRGEILNDNRRADGRSFTEIRDLTIEVGVVPRTHGSALFTRGETQAFVTTTLGTSSDAQMLDWMEGESFKRFMVHYNFPPFSVGEVKFLRGPGRREIGHGVLAERALRAMVPPEDEFPYTIRLVSDIFESNGSSSMASVCGGSLAMMDAGVPMRAPVAGIAMGLVKEGDRYAVLTDIAGEEDHVGDMDFKVAGTRDGITALQMDIKVTGLTRQVLQEALEQAREGRFHILDAMEGTISQPAEELSPHAPRIYQIQIPKEKIGTIIGPGGKMIRSITEETGTKIEVADDGTVTVASSDESGAREALEIIRGLTAEPEVGKIYEGEVVRLMDFGAFVEIMPGTDGLLHISEISTKRVESVQDVLQVGDRIRVKLVEIDHMDRIRLSAKVLEDDYDPEIHGTGRRSDERRGGGGGDRRGGGRPGGGRSGGGRSGGGGRRGGRGS